jgi:CRISPR-associated protein Csm3
MRRTAIHTVEGTLECLTALHIGGSQDDLQIGGTDLPVIRHPVTLSPYIPGSSLKGKMRSELEKQLGKFGGRNGEEPCGCADTGCPVCRIFGPHKNTGSELGPTRLLVRDAHLTLGGEIEIKTENVINRKTGAAEHPRKQERVAAGSKFHVEFKLQVYDLDENFKYRDFAGDKALLAVVQEALKSVEQTGLGAGTSRGSGKVRFLDLTLDGRPWQ